MWLLKIVNSWPPPPSCLYQTKMLNTAINSYAIHTGQSLMTFRSGPIENKLKTYRSRWELFEFDERSLIRRSCTPALCRRRPMDLLFIANIRNTSIFRRRNRRQITFPRFAYYTDMKRPRLSTFCTRSHRLISTEFRFETNPNCSRSKTLYVTNRRMHFSNYFMKTKKPTRDYATLRAR